MRKKGTKHEDQIRKNDRQADLAATEEQTHPAGATGGGVDGGQGQGQATPEALEGRIAELTHDLQRLQAEFANYKRREAEAKQEITDYATAEVVTALLPLLDNIERALAHKPAELKDNAWATGVEQVGKQVSDALKVLGVERLQSVGQPFDHNLHEAISMEDGDGHDEVVVEELQPGYKIGERVIRHAMVKVGRK